MTPDGKIGFAMSPAPMQPGKSRYKNMIHSIWQMPFSATANFRHCQLHWEFLGTDPPEIRKAKLISIPDWQTPLINFILGGVTSPKKRDNYHINHRNYHKTPLQRGTPCPEIPKPCSAAPQVIGHRAVPWDQVPGAEVLSPEVRPKGRPKSGWV